MAKRKEAIKKGRQHWSAFDEKIWGPTRLEALLDEFLDAIDDGRVISIGQFLAKKRIKRRYWNKMVLKHVMLDESMDVVRDAIYGKIKEIVAYDGAPPALLKDCYRYCQEDVELDLKIQERHKEADHKRKESLEELKIKLQTGDTDKSFVANIYLDGKKINNDAK